MKKIVILLLLPFAILFANIGKLTVVSGDVSLIKGGKSQKAVSGTQIDEQDQLITKSNSSTQIIFKDGTAISLGANTNFKVSEYLFEDNNPKKASARFGVSEGAFKAITGKIGKVAPDKFKMETRTATIGIRGTRFIGMVPRMGPEMIACTRGSIVVAIKALEQGVPITPREVKAGQITTVLNNAVGAAREYTPSELRDLDNASGPVLGSAKPNNANPQTATTTNSDSAQQNPVAQNTANENTNPIATTNNIVDSVQNIVSTVSDDAKLSTTTGAAYTGPLYGVSFGYSESTNETYAQSYETYISSGTGSRSRTYYNLANTGYTLSGTSATWNYVGSTASSSESVSYTHDDELGNYTYTNYSSAATAPTVVSGSGSYTLSTPIVTSASSTFTGYNNINLVNQAATYAYDGNGVDTYYKTYYSQPLIYKGYMLDSKGEIFVSYDYTNNYSQGSIETATDYTFFDNYSIAANYNLLGKPTVASTFFTNNPTAIGKVYGFVGLKELIQVSGGEIGSSASITSMLDYSLGSISYSDESYSLKRFMFGGELENINTAGGSNYLWYEYFGSNNQFSTPTMLARVFPTRISVLDFSLGRLFIGTSTTDQYGNLGITGKEYYSTYNDDGVSSSTSASLSATLLGSEAQAVAGYNYDSLSGSYSSFGALRTTNPVSTADKTGISTISGFAVASTFGNNFTPVTYDYATPAIALTGNDTITATVNHDTGAVSANITHNGTSYALGSNTDVSQSAYINNNIFAAASSDGKAFMYAFDAPNAADYVSWGYWSVNTGSSTTSVMPFSTWVAGVETPTLVLQSLATNNVSYTYNGALRGVQYDMASGVASAISGSNNTLSLDVSFGSGQITGGSLTIQGLSLATLSGTVNTSANSFAASGAGAGLVNVQGKFYGPSAEQAAGTFAASYDSVQAAGVFKLKR